MSMRLMVEVMGLKLGSPLKKLVLLKLADNANDKGECWPSYGHIADQCEIGKSTVRKHVKELEDMGFLKVENRKGPKGNTSNLYHIIAHPVSPDSIGCITSEHTPVSPDSTGTSHIESVKETVNETVWPSYITKEIESEIKSLRKAAKAPLTDRSKKMLIKQLDLAIQSGYTIDQCMDVWSISGWRSFEADWMKKKVPPLNLNTNQVEARKAYEQPKKQSEQVINGLKGLKA
jgi:biotin operon repressor